MMRRMNRAAIATAAAAVILVAPVTSTAHASETDWTDIQEFWQAYGVPESVQADLIAGLEAGDLPDVLDPAVEPVSTVTLGEYEQVSTYPDGSISVSSIGPGSGVAPSVIGGCSVSSGGGFATYTNCTVSHDNGFLYLSFKANYTRYAGGANISAAHTPVVSAAYGSATNPTVSIVRPTASGSVPAVATASTYWTGTGGGSETVYMSLRVTSASAWTTDY